MLSPHLWSRDSYLVTGNWVQTEGSQPCARFFVHDKKNNGIENLNCEQVGHFLSLIDIYS